MSRGKILPLRRCSIGYMILHIHTGQLVLYSNIQIAVVDPTRCARHFLSYFV